MNQDGAASSGSPIVYSPLPRFAVRPPLIALLLLPCMFVAAALGMYFGGTPNRWVWTVGGIAVFIAVVSILSLYMQHYHRFGHIRPSAIDEQTGLAATLLDLQKARSFCRKRDEAIWPWEQIAQSVNGPLPRTVAETRMQKRLAAIGLIDDMLEPETILGSLPMKRGMLIFMIALYVLLIINAGWSVAGLLIAIGAVALLLQLPFLRDKFRWGEGTVIAGLGVVETSRGKRWTVNDAIMIVQAQNGEPPLTVCFTGESGELVLQFIDERDPDFIKLWQRWNHPDPRPELLVT